MTPVDEQQLKIWSILPKQAVVKRGGFWQASITLTEIERRQPQHLLSLDGEQWFRLRGVATLEDGRTLDVCCHFALVSNGKLYSAWERVDLNDQPT
jgi:hypothetical protein